MQTEESIPNEFTNEVDSHTLALWELNQRQTEKHKTKYVFTPFMDVPCSQVPGGAIPANTIYCLSAPKGKTLVNLLPQGAQVLMLVGPDRGLPIPVDPRQTPPPQPPEIAALTERIKHLEAAAVPLAPKNIAVYLHEVPPIVSELVQIYAKYGLIEIKSLREIPDGTFHANRLGDLILGPEAERPRTAEAYRARMSLLLEKAAGETNDAARVIAGAAREILASVETCDDYCARWVKQRHSQLESTNYDHAEFGPQRYSRHDLRAIEFCGAIKLADFKQQILDEQRQSVAAIPVVLELQRQQNEKWAQMFERMLDVIDRQSVSTKTTKKGEPTNNG